MRLWHYRLLPYLPRQQLLSQWRECCCIAKSIAEKDTPNHILVNKIMDYPIDHFYAYCFAVSREMQRRNYKCNWKNLQSVLYKIVCIYVHVELYDIFPEWHNDIYLRECLYNLEEKAMCNGIPADEWQVIYDRFKDFTPLWEGK